jgi:uncharacterized membrane protein
VKVAALILALSAAASWGVGGILLKKGTNLVSPTTILVFQYAVGIVVIGGWLAATGGAATALHGIERRWQTLLVLVSLQIVGYLFFVVAIKNAGEGSLPTSTVIAIAASYPALVAVLSAPFLGESLGWQQFLGVGLIIGGVIVSQVH